MPSDAEPDRARPRRWRQRLLAAAEIATLLVAFGALLVWCSIPNTARLADENPTSTAFIDLRREQAAAAGKPLALEWQWRPLGKISRYLRAAVVYAEDGHFYEHDGVDWHAIEVAFDKNMETGELSVGGSTITQQLAKNLYLSPSRSMIRKLREMLIAFSLEDHLTKQRILELYLNVAEWGDGVFGAEAAARHWFGHSSQSLSPSEAARLAIALPNPLTRAPTVQSDELRKKAVRIIRLLRMQGLINAAQERTALDDVGAQSAVVRPDKSLPPSPAEALPASPSPPAQSLPAPTRPSPAPSQPPATPQPPAESPPPPGEAPEATP
ncbi:MAG TPA: monofunctional biosynthetic peptidoglycan transglycosylase [Kofleriaceae bacterium]